MFNAWSFLRKDLTAERMDALFTLCIPFINEFTFYEMIQSRGMYKLVDHRIKPFENIKLNFLNNVLKLSFLKICSSFLIWPKAANVTMYHSCTIITVPRYIYLWLRKSLSLTPLEREREIRGRWRERYKHTVAFLSVPVLAY